MASALATMTRAAVALVTAAVLVASVSAPAAAAVGHVLWQRQLATSGASQVTAVASTLDAVYVTELDGTDYGPDCCFGITWGKTTAQHAAVSRYSIAGDLVWTHSIVPVSGRVGLWAIAADDTGVYVGGLTDGVLPGQTDPHVLQSGFIARLDPGTGDVTWIRQFALGTTGPAITFVTRLRLTSAGLFVGGWDGSGQWVAAYSSTGERAWLRQTSLGMADDSTQGLMDADSDGALVAGYDFDLSSSGSDFETVVHFDTDGDVTSEDHFPVQGIWGSAVAPGGGYYLVDLDGQLRRYDDTGHQVWSHLLGSGCFPEDMVSEGDSVFLSLGCDDGERIAGYRGDGTLLWTLSPDDGQIAGTAIDVNATGAYVVGWSGSYPDAVTGTLERISVDATPPITVWQANRIPPFIIMPGDRVTIAPSWRASDNLSGVAQYQLQQSNDGKVWNGVTLGDPLARSVLIDAKPGENTFFRARAIDGAGNVGAWTKSPGYAVALDQEVNKAISYGAGWKLTAVSDASAGSVMSSSIAGAHATFTFSGESFGVVTTAGPDRGKFTAYVDGVKAGVFDLYAPQQEARWVAFAQAFPKNGTHHVKIVVKGTKGRPEVDIDAFEVLALAP